MEFKEMYMNTEDSKVIALRFATEGWGNVQGWGTVWDDVVAADVIYHHPGLPNPIQGLEAAKAFSDSLFKGFPDIQQTIEMIVAEDSTVAIRHLLKGTHTGDFLGIPPTGKQVTESGTRFFRLSKGKIVETWYEINLLGVMQQLGAIA
jgi:steroid delta-isomerase-like uncharacterized protein